MVPRRMRGRAVGASVLALLAGSLGAAGATGSTGTDRPDYEPDVESLESHPLPEWFDDSKFGIFIHWGAYSVPAWGPRGSYAEWYWQYMNNAGSPTYEHHRDTYGAETNYDAFLDQWQAENFEPEQWIDLFNDAGAKYFVLTSKHHEGMALWDTATSERDTVERGPARDLAGELFDAAEADGKLKTGFYYSLYEWFNPNYTGRPATNPYTGDEIPYTGVEPVDDYVQDYMKPQMMELIDDYDPDILWCDGEWERDSPFWDLMPVIAHYYNQAKNREDPKDVVVANRCKIQPGLNRGDQLDFTTPEYEVEPDINPVKWESSRGIAHSYGYNRNEPVEDYLTSDELVDSLADIVSKNGNLLLNIGPKADGTIPELQQERLRDIGGWLDVNGQAIYGTTYYNHAEDAHSNVPVRYTVSDGDLYAIALEWPGERLTLGGDLPFSRTTRVQLLGGDDAALDWQRDDDGNVAVTMPERSGEYAHVLKISTPGVDQLVRTRVDSPSEINPGTTGQLTVELTNTGRSTSPAVRLDPAGPQGWNVEPERTVLPGLAPGETVEVPVEVSAPAAAQPGEYEISLTTTVGLLRGETSVPVAVELPNLALGKPAEQKSLDWDGGPELAVDGDVDGNFQAGSVTHTAEPETQAWWQVDLEATHDIEEIEIWNRTDCCAERLSDYWVMVSEAPITGDSLDEARNAPGVTAIHQPGQAERPTTLDLDGVSGRYVRVQLASESDPLSLAEVQVRGR